MSDELMNGRDLPEGWQVVQLGELGSISGGTTPSTKVPEYWDGGIAWATPSDVTKCTNIFIDDTTRKITQAGLDSCTAGLLPAGSVLMTSRATIGKVVINTIPMATNQGFINVVCDPKIVFNQYLAFWIGQNKQTFEDRANGVTFREISKSNFKDIFIPLPPLPEQRAIAYTLRTVQAAREARRREAALERTRKAALMQRLFTRGTRGEPTKTTEIGEVPVSWQVVRLGDYCEFLQYGTSKYCDNDPSGIPVLRIPNVIGGKVDTEDLKYIQLPSKEAAGLRLEQGDILFVRTNGNREYAGRCAVFQNELDDALFASYLIRARLAEAYLPEFVQLYTETASGKSFLSGRASNAADGKYNINTQTIKSVMLPLPSIEEQSTIATTLRACDDKIAALEREAAAHDELFKALLEELMTGRRRATELVER